jgi:alkylation response protein AidB-like acyl-CoA dehydrogenase
MIQTMVKDFVNDQMKPMERDILGRAADLNDAMASLPLETEEKLMKMVQELGLWGIGVPDELGGPGLGVLGNCLIEEELAQTIIPFNLGDVTPILFDCNEEQKQNYFLPVLNKQKSGLLAFIEPGKEADLTNIEMTAEKANSHYILNGKKLSFTKPRNDYFAMVFANTDPDKELKDRVTCFLVDKDLPGFTVIGGEEKTGWQTQKRDPVLLVFDKCEVPAEKVLGEEGKAFLLGKKWLPQRRIIRGARCVGVAYRVLEEATIQAQNWSAFGQPISGRPSIQAALADISANIHAAKLMVYEAAWKADKGEPVHREASMVKIFTTQMLNGVVDNATHIWNGPPHIAGLPMEILCRNLVATSAIEYGLDLQRNLIATDILKGLKT